MGVTLSGKGTDQWVSCEMEKTLLRTVIPAPMEVVLGTGTVVESMTKVEASKS